MSRILYFDGFSGASGDMVLGALVDAGVPIDVLRGALGSLALEGVTLDVERVMRAGVAATKFHVRVHGVRPDADPARADAVGDDASLAPGAAAPHAHPHGHAHEHTHAHTHEHVHEGVHAHGHEHAREDGHTHVHEHAHEGGETHSHPHEHRHTHEHGHTQGHEHAHHGHGHTHDHEHGTHNPAPRGHDHGHRSLSEIAALIGRSALSDRARATAVAWMTRLAEAEAAIHKMPVERCTCTRSAPSTRSSTSSAPCSRWSALGADRIVCSPLNVGGGMVRSAHGVFPVPAPATLRLLAGVPIYSAQGRARTGDADRRL